MTLVSDPTPEFPNNTNTAFQVRLSDPLQLKGDGWETALVSISTPNKGIDAASFGMQDDDTLCEVTYSVVKENPVTMTAVSKEIRASDIFNIDGGVHSGAHLMELIRTRILRNMREVGQATHVTSKQETRMYWDLNVTPELTRSGDDASFSLTFHDRSDTKCQIWFNKALGVKMGWWKDDGTLGPNVIPQRNNWFIRNPTRAYFPSVSSSDAAITSTTTSQSITHRTTAFQNDLKTRSYDMIELSRNYTWQMNNLNAAFHYAVSVNKRAILVYTDLVQTSYMGHQKHELLREIFLKHNQHDTQ